MTQDTLEFLEHHGVKGMHWGIRTGHNRTTSSDYKKTAPYRKRKAQELTNKQLKNVNERINLEQNYKRLNQSTVKKGEAAAKGIIGLAGTATALYTLSTSPVAKALVRAGKHAILTAKILKVVHSVS